MTHEWIKWWKNKTFVTILCIVLFAIIIGFLLAYFIEWGWIITIVLTCICGIAIRIIVSKKLDEISDKDTSKIKNNLYI